ncbi:MAG: peptide chain release factor N(5)-glutamine methyltransferase [Planctomycetes bacterium]|nr:peptide chain release factor N(5)-glutamine methyltransferase [Planctomycetota bacterium]
MWILQNLLKKASRYLEEKKIPESRLEAEILLAHVLAMDRIGLYTHFERPVAEEELSLYRTLIMRRARGEPSAYLVGRKEFFSLSFTVNASVLIPRPETEDLVQMALERIPGQGEGLMMADLGTGSGCIAITLLHLRTRLEAWVTDISLKALNVAKTNAVAHGVDPRIKFLCGDLLTPLRTAAQPHPFFLITCNPPYVDPEGPWPVMPDVRTFEPNNAVFTPEGDGAYYYRKVLDSAKPLLAKEGYLLFELGMGMRDMIVTIAEERGWRLDEVRKDLAGIDRVLIFQSA